MIDNLELLLPFIDPQSDDDFYYLQILQRKKENELMTSNSRVIKNYYIRSPQYLLDRYEEIKKLCNLFNARASLRLNKRSFEKVGFKTMVNLANTMSNKEYQFLPKSYDRAVGANHNDAKKKWILDIDDRVLPDLDRRFIMDQLKSFDPIGGKLLAHIPSKTGIHIITTPFNVKQAEDLLKNYQIEVHKDNPTNLYIP